MGLVVLLFAGVGLDLAQRGSGSLTPEVLPSTSFGDSNGAGDVSGDIESDDSSVTPPSSSRTRSSRDVTCWDGRRTSSRDDCSMPEGKRGMEWIFPDSTSFDCGRTGSGSRRASVWCYPGSTRIHYSEWFSSSEAQDEYAFGQDSTRVANWQGYLRWNIAARDGSSKLALVHPSAPFSVTIYADTPQQRDRALEQLDVRPLSMTRAGSGS